MSLPPQSDQPIRRKVQKSEIMYHVPLTRVKGAPPSTPKRITSPPMVAIGPPSLSRIHWFGLVGWLACRFGLQRIPIDFANFLQDCTWHANRHHRLCAAPAHRTNIHPSRSVQPFGLQRRKCLDKRTYIHTNIGQTTFSQRTTRGNLRAKLSTLTH